MANFSLAVEASSDQISVGVRTDGGTYAVRTASRSDRSTRTVPQLADELLRAQQLSITDCEAVLVGAGPGSFTGIRGALAYAVGLATGVGAVVQLLPSFAAIDQVVGGSEPLLVLASAGRGEFFLGNVVQEGAVRTLEIASQPQPAATIRAAYPTKVIRLVVGDHTVEGGVRVTLSAELLLKAHDCWRQGTLVIDQQTARNSLEFSKLEPWYVRAVAATSIAERAPTRHAGN